MGPYEGVMNPSARVTKQGVRDLNTYGPKPEKATAGEPQETSDGEPKVVPLVSETGTDAALPVAG
jgi:hypothetical protein